MLHSSFQRQRDRLFAISAWPVALVTACTGVSHCEKTAVPNPTDSAGRESTTAPLPGSTEFEHEPKLRQAYLDSFTRAYQLALSGSDYAGLGCLCEAGGDEQVYEAAVAGFFVGKKAGEMARETAARESKAAQP